MGCCGSKDELRFGLNDLAIRGAPLHESQFLPDNYTFDEDNPTPIVPTKGYQIEIGSIFSRREIIIALENPDQYSFYYRDNFYNTEHINFIGGGSDEPFVVSVQFRTKKPFPPDLKLLIRSRKLDLHATIPFTTNKNRITSQIQQIIRNNILNNTMKIHLKEIKSIDLTHHLTHMEDRLLMKNYKFGIIYCKEGQRTDDEMFSNESGSELFDEFLEMLGERIALKGWNKFDGELDVKTNTTGVESLYTVVDGFEIMFHVSTFLPYSKVNPQQIERKRHIGNDIVCIVFQDGPTPFDPTKITSKYNHVYIVVQVVHSGLERKSRSKSKPQPVNNSNATSPTTNNSNAATEPLTGTKDEKRKKRSKSKTKSGLPDNLDAQSVLSAQTGTTIDNSGHKGGRRTRYRISIVSKKGCKPFGPLLPKDPVFRRGTDCRNFLLAKAINGERASYYAPGFGLYRTRKAWLSDIVQRYS
mmetsp:Transcript_22288/g.31070  ORF Transcript_22288/g.31070 Transcript_22288/m.31070 type:complete len:470 (-) Transcript_22288:938-2347(-)